ncbi:hypothetical protein CR513_26038, partial [Mucuna pruriens]
MTVRTKIDVHVGTLSMEFSDNMLRFNIFEAIKHLTKNHSIFSLNVIDVFVDDYMQLHFGLSVFSKFSDFANFANVIDLVGFDYAWDGVLRKHRKAIEYYWRRKLDSEATIKAVEPHHS